MSLEGLSQGRHCPSFKNTAYDCPSLSQYLPEAFLFPAEPFGHRPLQWFSSEPPRMLPQARDPRRGGQQAAADRWHLGLQAHACSEVEVRHPTWALLACRDLDARIFDDDDPSRSVNLWIEREVQ